MERKTAMLGVVIMLAFFTSAAWAGMAVPVSPGGGTELTGQNCPTFSWSAMDGASSYRIEVYEQVASEIVGREAMSIIANPVVEREISAPALSWTPSSGECFSRGMRYVWYVRGVDAQGEGQWSGGMGFQVEAEALSIEQKKEVQDVVKELVNAESANGTAASTASGTESGALRTAFSITPMALSVISAYGDATNVALGYYTATALTTGFGDTFIGDYAGQHNTIGSYNSFVGEGAGSANTDGNNNSFFGTEAGFNNITGDDNSFVGRRAGYSNSSGHSSSFVGYFAGYNNSTGSSNSFFGSNAGRDNVVGSHNSFVGDGSGYRNKGYNNSFFGSQTGFYNIDGDSNVFLGYWAGYSETGSNKLYIDNCATGNTPSTGGNCSQPLIYGEFDNRIVRIDGRLEMVTMATPSDIRYKKEIHTLDSPLEKVLQLQGVTYEWDMDKVKGAGFQNGKQIGLIAQEVEKVLPELVHTDSNGYKTLSYDKLGPILVEAIKAQQQEIKEKETQYETSLKEKDARIARLEKELQDQKKSLTLQQAAISSMMARMASLENRANSVALK